MTAAPTSPSALPIHGSSEPGTCREHWPPTRMLAPGSPIPVRLPQSMLVVRPFSQAPAGRPKHCGSSTRWVRSSRCERASSWPLRPRQSVSVGRFPEARAIARSAASDHADLPGWFARRGIAQHLVNEAHAFAYAGHYAEARELLEPAAERALAAGALGAWVWFEMALAEVARDTGRANEAIRRFSAVADVAPTIGQDAALVWAHVGVAQGHLLLGHCVEAAAALARADDAGDSPVATSIATRERTRAWLDACRGDLEAARQRIRDAVLPIQRDEVYIFESALLHDLVRFGVPGEVVARLEVLAARIEGPLATIHAAHARALVDRDVVALRDVSEQYASLDALGLASEVAAELADLHRARGEARLATAALQRSAELADLAGGLHSPVLSRGAGIEPLTARERDVALLAARGRSSRDIGERLGLSTRTVDTHLARVYRKLGIGGRSDLATALEPHDGHYVGEAPSDIVRAYVVVADAEVFAAAHDRRQDDITEEACTVSTIIITTVRTRAAHRHVPRSPCWGAFG